MKLTRDPLAFGEGCLALAAVRLQRRPAGQPQGILPVPAEDSIIFVTIGPVVVNRLAILVRSRAVTSARKVTVPAA